MGMLRILAALFLIFLKTSMPTFLLFANRKDIRLINVQRPRGNSSLVIASNLEDAAGVDFLYSDGMIFWTDINLEMIKRTMLNSSGEEMNVITTGLASPDGLSCDWLARKLYWSDSETNRIEVSNLDGSYRKVLFWEDIDQPRAIALVPMDGLIFWSDWGEGPKIERAGMDGDKTTRMVIVSNDIFWPNGLTIDYEAKRVYWADAKLNFISKIDFNGKNRQTVIQGDLPHPFALTVQGDVLFWTDWHTRSIHMCNKKTGANRKTVLGNTLNPMDIHVYSAERQPAASTPCDVNNGGCSHLCLLSPLPKRYSCACAIGIRLLEDNKTCAEDSLQILVLARRSDVRRISLDTTDYTDVVIPLTGVRHTVAVDYDPVENQIYWTDDEALVIRRANLDGGNQEDLIVSEVDHPDGIAIDWIARNMYWTDTGTDRIEVARLNGTSRKVIIAEDLEEPRAIVVDSILGYLYWTDWGKRPRIERAVLDGTDRMVLVSIGLGWPNGLALDYERQKIYWGDAKTDKIEYMNIDGTDRRELISDHLPHIFGFSLLGDYVYWTDWQKRSIERVNKFTGEQREVIVDQLPDLMGLKAVDVKKAIGTSPCADNNGGCSHLCLNKPNSIFVCACPMGLELTTNEKTCILPEAFLLFSRRADIRRISLETNHNDVVIPLAGVKEASALDFDISDNRIYWTDISLKAINRAFLNGSNLEQIIEFGLEFPEGIAIDWVAHNIYWADIGSNRIEVSRLDGTSRKVLIWKDLEGPRSITVDPNAGYIYWSDWRANPRIERSALDGSKRTVVIENIGRANGLTLDNEDKRLYWANIDSHVIESSDLSGSFLHSIVASDLQRPYSLTQYQDYLYWTDWNTLSIERANKTNGENRTRIQGNLDHIIDIHVFHSSRQSGWNTCAVNNGGCSHLCLAQPAIGTRQTNSNYCACPTHYTLHSDNKTCNAPSSFMLFTQKNTISRLMVDSNDAPDIVLPIHGLKNIKALTYDPVDKYLYWIDSRTHSIRRGSDNGSYISVMVPNSDDLYQPYDVAIDPYSRLLFWTCAKNNVINITRLDMASVGIVIAGQDQMPRSLVLHPKKGLMFWTNVANPPKIERAEIDGMKKVTLFSTDLEELGSIAIDTEKDMLFWIETHHKLIETADIHGANRKTLVSSHLYQPISLTVYDKYLYWIDREPQIIERVNKLTGDDRERIPGQFNHLSDLLATQNLDPNFKYPCQKNFGGCSHLCIPDAENEYRCSCPNTLVLTDDNKLCDEPPTCSPDEFACEAGAVECIPRVWRCDGSVECDDHSDEIDCPPCTDNQFRCHNGQCIESNLVCNGKSDCSDDSDEEQCCQKGEFYCEKYHECVQQSVACDRTSDCQDSSDERKCIREKALHQSSNTGITVGVLLSFTMIIICGVLIYFCKRRSLTVMDDLDENLTIIASKTQSLQINSANVISGLSTTAGSSRALCQQARQSVRYPIMSYHPQQITSNSSPTYDRNYVTGASSSSSSATNYPHETLNPPPSPVTDQSQCTTSRCTSSSAAPKTYRYFSMGYPNPHPTPCSTDVCDDSDRSQGETYPRRNRGLRNWVDSSVKKHHSSLQHQKTALLSTRNDPLPPPPTPRSLYLSEDNESSPPSPYTERSYFNPCPPPPSPVIPLD